jgi:hypothetical protein
MLNISPVVCKRVLLGLATIHCMVSTAVSSVLDTKHSLSVLTESDLRTAVRDTLVEATTGIITCAYHGHILSICLQTSHAFFSYCLEIGLSDVLSHSSLPPSLNNLQTTVQTIVGKYILAVTLCLPRLCTTDTKPIVSDYVQTSIHHTCEHTQYFCYTSKVYSLQMLLKLHE